MQDHGYSSERPDQANYTVHLQEIRPRGTINGFRARESACDAVTVDRYGFSYRWFINRDTSKHSTQVSIRDASRRMSDAS